MSDLINQVSLILPGAIATAHLGQRLAEILPAGTVIFLEGNLGAGKTTFVQGLGAGLGITETIDSPTFTLINEYMTGRLPLYHLDLYRLTSEEIDSLYLDLYRLTSEEIEGLYLENYWEGIEVTPGIMAIEWGEKLTMRPDNYLQIDFHYDEQQENQRQVFITLVGNSLNFISPEFLLGCVP